MLLEVECEQGSKYFETSTVVPSCIEDPRLAQGRQAAPPPQFQPRVNISCPPVPFPSMPQGVTQAFNTRSWDRATPPRHISALKLKHCLPKDLCFRAKNCEIVSSIPPVWCSCLRGTNDIGTNDILYAGSSEYILIRCGEGGLITKCKCCSRDTLKQLEASACSRGSNAVTEDIGNGQR